MKSDVSVTGKPSIREALSPDLEVILAFDEIAQREPGRVAFLQRAIDKETCLVATRDEQVVGYGILNYGFYDQGFIPLIYVRADCRRSGIATRLIEALEERCETPKLFTSTNDSNAPMKALLKQMGFAACGIIYNLDPGDPEIVFCKDKTSAGAAPTAQVKAMEASAIRARGECNCGSVAFEVSGELSDVYVCHCSICRRFTGSNGIAVVIVANDAFRWVRGEEAIALWAKPGADWQSHFCRVCGSAVPGPNDESRMFIPAGTISTGGESLRVAHHIWVGSKAEWDEIGDSGQRHMDAFQTPAPLEGPLG